GRLARGAPRSEQLLGAHERDVQELLREVLQAWVARARPEEVGGEERAEVPVALAAAERPHGELGLLGVVAADGAIGQRARYGVHRLGTRHVERVAACRAAHTDD